MKKILSWKILAIVLVALTLGFVDIPQQYQPDWSPQAVKNLKIHLGLDLQGGSQLDYKIDLRRVPLEDRESIVEGVTEVINKRVNNLGVSEPNIYTSEVAGEHHIIVELAGLKNLEEAKAKIGKTVQLEFKEQKTEADPAEKEAVKTQAQKFLQSVQGKDSFEVYAEEESKAFAATVDFTKNPLQFKDEFVESKLFDEALNYNKGDIIPKLIEGTNGFLVRGQNDIVENTGYFVVQVGDRVDDGTKEIDEGKKISARHALIAYQGAYSAGPWVTRTKEEAKILAEELAQKAQNGEQTLEEIAKEHSDEAGADETGGKLEQPVKAIDDGGIYVKAFTEAALELETGEISDAVETEFGFHIIGAEEVTDAVSEVVTEPKLALNTVFYSTLPDPWQETELTGEHFEYADVQFDQLYQPYVSITFNEEGGELFGEITERNVDKPVAIFVGGDLISSPVVRQKITGGSAIITGQFSVEEATALARDLNTGAIPAPITLAGQYTIGATLGQNALHMSLVAGLIGLAALALYMILYYRLPGLIAVGSLSIYSIVLVFLIKVAMPLAVALTLSVMIFIVLMTKIINGRDSGWEKFISFVLACFILFFFSFLFSTPVVLTLAGVAGIILSIGMAVDANVLIFERVKEELKNDRPLGSAIEIGFERAWSSIRDGNFSTLITCVILAYFGTSIIRGFALNLAAGVLLSMFTAITITKTFMMRFIGTKISNNTWLFGHNKRPKRTPFKIIEKTKLWFGLSGVFIAIGLFSIFTNGLNLGIDFRGGTRIDINFEKAVTTEELRTTLKEVEESFKRNQPASTSFFVQDAYAGHHPTHFTPPSPSPSSGERTIPEFVEEGPYVTNFGNPTIVTSGAAEENGYIIRMEYITEEEHNAIIDALEEKFGAVEESLFTTIGPLIGSSLKKKAVVSLGLALLAIILYIAFAFRHVPKKVSPWRFGICAIAALAHDVLIVLGVFAFLGLEINALFITALLAIIGFSINDTIVVFDRIRENLKTHGGEDFTEVANKSLSETVTRSINTSLSTLFTLVAIFLYGSLSIHSFIFALILGVVVGTYSSIFTASPLLVAWNKMSERR